MNPFTNTLSLHPLYEELIQDLKSNPEFDIEGETLHDFKSNHKSEIGIDKGIEDFGIYLSFGPKESDNKQEFYNELYQYWPIFIQPLKTYLETLFSENTNNDACSFNISFDTDHAVTDEESFWTLSISVSDYLS